jgi:hypothetical protein
MMALSGDLFKQIISQLKSATDTDERRGEPRVGMRTRARLAILGPGGKMARSMEVGVTDLSMGGIGLMHNAPILPDTIFAIRLPLRGSRDMTVVYKVRNCRPLEEGYFRIGAMLIQTEDPGPLPTPETPTETVQVEAVK